MTFKIEGSENAIKKLVEHVQHRSKKITRIGAQKIIKIKAGKKSANEVYQHVLEVRHVLLQYFAHVCMLTKFFAGNTHNWKKEWKVHAADALQWESSQMPRNPEEKTKKWKNEESIQWTRTTWKWIVLHIKWGPRKENEDALQTIQCRTANLC